MYTVVWTKDASDQLAACWLNAALERRAAITTIVATIDMHLRANAPRIGESRVRNRRVLIEEPLGVEFRVSESDRLVTVLKVWSIPQRRM